MDKRFLYSAAYMCADKLGSVAYNTMLVFARSEEEAIGMAIKEAERRNPMHAGWGSYQAIALLVNKETLERGLQALTEGHQDEQA